MDKLPYEIGYVLFDRMSTESRIRYVRSYRDGSDNGAHSQELEVGNGSPEAEGKVKSKIMSMWNNVKYGWTVKLKTNFSKDSPVWLLGKCYHKKMIIKPNDNGSTVACEEGDGIEGFKIDFISRIWLTYRREFATLTGSKFTSDCGWGCMLRSGQMMLAQGLVCHFLGRGWRWRDEPPTTAKMFSEDINHRKIIKWFGDNPSCNSPFSIHTLVMLGEATGKKAGDWYGPGSVSHMLRQAVELASKDNTEFEHLCVYVAQDCAVYIQDVVDMCEVAPERSPSSPHLYRTVPSWKSVILLIPIRLGAEKLNSLYGPCITAVLTLENCIGIIGGRPKHSLYFIGFQDDKLIHLDPHYCQDVVDVWQPNFSLWSFHCRSPRKMNLSKLDPSCCIGFYCRTREDFYKFVTTVKQLVVPPDEISDYPMFVFCEGRSKDVLTVNHLSISDVIRHSDLNLHETDDELECEEFEIL